MSSPARRDTAMSSLARLLTTALIALGALAVAREAAAAEVHTRVDDVRACLPLDDGRVIAASAGGLAQLGSDDRVERVWTSLDGLADTRARTLFLDGTTLWVGTDRGLTEMSVAPAGLSFVRSIPSPAVHAITRHQGSVHVGTWGAGVLRLDAAKGTLAPVASSTLRVGSFAVVDGALFAAAERDGLVRVDANALVPVRAPELPSTVWSVAATRDRLWVGGLEGIASWSRGVAQREATSDGRAMTSIADGSILVATMGDGLLASNARGLSAASAAPAARLVQTIGARGNVRCVATSSELLVSRAGGPWRAVGASGLPSNDVSAIARSTSMVAGRPVERLWVGTFDRGLATFESGTWTTIASPRLDSKINAIAIERIGDRSIAWVATARGLTRIEARIDGRIDGDAISRMTSADGLPSSEVHAVAPLAAGGVIVGTGQGAAIVRAGRVTALGDKQGLKVRAVWAVAELPSGLLLVGASNGLYAGRASDAGAWRRRSVASNELADDWVTALAVHGPDVFVGTYSQGVTRIHAIESAHPTSDHLGGGYVNLGGVAIVDGTLTAATMGGLLVRPVDGAKAWRAVANATPGRDVTAVVPGWAASRRGIARVASAEIL
jgi:ligand-binding sensor domain-containing protein